MDCVSRTSKTKPGALRQEDSGGIFHRYSLHFSQAYIRKLFHGNLSFGKWFLISSLTSFSMRGEEGEIC